jgi:hypothetical protein
VTPEEIRALTRMLADLDERLRRIELFTARQIGPLPPLERTYDWSDTKLIADEIQEVFG